MLLAPLMVDSCLFQVAAGHVCCIVALWRNSHTSTIIS
jgi:hypothetical protein